MFLPSLRRARPVPCGSAAEPRATLLPGALSLLGMLAGCAGNAVQPAVAPAPAPSFSAFVVLGEQGAAVARVLTEASACPAIRIDGREHAMQLRAGAATLPLRPTSSPPAQSKAAAFPVLSCDAALPPATVSASVLGQPLALPKAAPQRIVVIGDTGCRLKLSHSGDSFQACNDARAYPFASIAAAAAAWRPDLVIHVGDYHYREHACPDSEPGCAGSPWGYGWDTWQADFFTPGAALLRAAPWVMARGNHESCGRAGQGFWRLLDPRPLLPGRDCNAAADDGVGDYSDPYAVPLDAATQLLVVDTASTSWRGFQPGTPGYAHYRDSYRQLAALAGRAPNNIGITHHPLLGFGTDRKPDGGTMLQLGDAGLQQAFGSLNPLLLPAPVQTMLSGHVHQWQQTSFASDHPSQFIAGFSGTAEDVLPLPDPLPPGTTPAPGAVLEALSSWVDGFGFMTLERRGPQQWDVTVRDRDGQLRNTCTIDGRQSRCAQARVR
ncbi:metallophosphoesterase [Oxalobacteraceae bacterium]|nr:metallophosphoesterase [Oxalobacteraceae bacterium]